MGIILTLLLSVLLSCSPTRLPSAAPEYLTQARKNFFHGQVRINYYEFGKGEPIVLLHGFGGAAYTWRHLVPALQKDRRVILIDLKGFGLSERPQDDKYSPHDQADIVKSFIEQKNLEKVTLAGHSFGGGVALLTYFKANQNKTRIKSLILLNSPVYPRSMPKFIKVLRIPLINVLLAKVTPARLAVRHVLKKAFYDDDKISPEIINAYTYYNQLPGSDYVLRKTAQQIIPPDIEAVIRKLPQIRVPVLLIWGWDDEIIPLAYGLKLHGDIPGSVLVSLKGCGHLPPEERPEETLAEINRFLKSLPD